MIINKINPKTGKPYNRQSIWRQSHPEKIELFRSYSKTPHALKISSIRTIKNKERLRKVKLAYYHKNKEKLKLARIKTGRYTKERLHSSYMADHYIPLDKNCGICKTTSNLERHHWNYNKPLMVSTLCRTCHKIQHIKNFPRWQKCKLTVDNLNLGVKI